MNPLIHNIIDILLPLKPHFHFGRMHIYIDFLTIHLKVDDYERKLVLHEKVLVCIFDCFGEHRIFHIPPVYKIIFKIPVSSGDHRFSKISFHHQTIHGIIQFDQICRGLSPVNAVDYIL